MNPHYFWAIRLPDDVKKTIFEKLEELKEFFHLNDGFMKSTIISHYLFLGLQKKKNWR